MKFLAKFAMTAAIIGGLATACFAEPYIGVVVNGKALFLDKNPVMKDGRVLVPLRGIFEALGANVKWDSATRSVVANTKEGEPGNTNLVLPVDSKTAKINNTEIVLEVPATIIDGTTMVPLRFVGETLGAKVKWDGEYKTVRVATLGNEDKLDPEIPELTDWDMDDLERIQFGIQAGLLRVLDDDGKQVEYTRTMDDFNQAQMTLDQRSQVLDKLDIQNEELRSLARKLISEYSNRMKTRIQMLSLLGVIADDDLIDDRTFERIQAFCVNKMLNGDKDLSQEQQNILKRHALLTLSLMEKTNYNVADAVVRLYETCDNLWVVAPVQFYFKCHAKDVKAMPQIDSIRSRLGAVQTIYTNNILDAIK